MAPRYDWSEQESRSPAEKPDMFWVLVAAGVAAFLGLLVAINGGSSSDCKAITDNTERLHCFDAAAQTQPAKGAQIPSH